MAPEKLKKLVHYTVARCDEPARLGATKLNKTLWYSDSIAYRLNAVSITGETYVKRQHGPVPKRVLEALTELESEGKIAVREATHFGFPQRQFISMCEPDKAVFSEQELSIINDVVDAICQRHTASSISDMSHDQVWEAAQIGEEIPLWATLAAAPGEITDRAKEWARSVIERVEAEGRASA